MRAYTVCLLVLPLLAAGGEASAKARCFSYDTSDFIIEKIVDGSEKIKAWRPDSLKIYFFENRSDTKPITVEYTINGKTEYNKYVYCMKPENTQYEWCGIECDGGGFNMKDDYSIKVDYMALYRDEPETKKAVEIILSQKSKNKFYAGNEFECPAEIPRAEIIDEKYYQDTPEGTHVCYDYKDDNKYYGCFRSVKTCRELHLQHFGKYPNKTESAKALQRCENSTPRKDYIDNRNGLHVCYDYRDENGYYSGCFRSLKPCARINKEHFGRYPSRAESAKALKRCMDSTPRQ